MISYEHMLLGAKSVKSVMENLDFGNLPATSGEANPRLLRYRRFAKLLDQVLLEKVERLCEIAVSLAKELELREAPASRRLEMETEEVSKAAERLALHRVISSRNARKAVRIHSLNEVWLANFPVDKDRRRLDLKAFPDCRSAFVRHRQLLRSLDYDG